VVVLQSLLEGDMIQVVKGSMALNLPVLPAYEEQTIHIRHQAMMGENS
jgi:hypothetical protein